MHDNNDSGDDGGNGDGEGSEIEINDISAWELYCGDHRGQVE